MVYQKNIKKKDYDVIIIGSGISGLVCGTCLASGGVSVLVLEQHFIPGGATTMFKRGDFWFEGGGHRITGISNPGGIFYELFKKIGKKINFTTIEPSYVVKIGERTLYACLDVEKYKANLIALFPEQKQNIVRFISDMQRISESAKYVSSGKVNLFTLLTKHRLFVQYAEKTTSEFIKNYFTDSELINFVTAVGNYTTLSIKDQSFFTFANIWAAHHLGEGMSLINGGTKVLVDTLVEYIDSNNGQVVISKDVDRIIIENGRAIGVCTKEGEQIRAKVVVSTVSNEETYFKLVGSEYLKPEFVNKIKKQTQSGALFQLFLGIKELDGRGLENTTTFILSTGESSDHLKKIYNWDIDAICQGGVITVEGKENSPQGTRSINISALCPFDRSKDWYFGENSWPNYDQFKEKIAQKLIQTMSHCIPNLENRIIVKNTATPLTMFRYTRATKGGLQGLAHTVAQSGKKRGSLKSPIKNLYRAGQYVFPGAGIVTVAISGKLCSELVIKEHFSRQK